MSTADGSSNVVKLHIVVYGSKLAATAFAQNVRKSTHEAPQSVSTREERAGATFWHVQFFLGALGGDGRMATVQLSAIVRNAGELESTRARRAFFDGVDGCVFVGGKADAAALARLDATLAAHGGSSGSRDTSLRLGYSRDGLHFMLTTQAWTVISSSGPSRHALPEDYAVDGIRWFDNKNAVRTSPS